jgi:NAD(P)H-dependent flavin oxidoreductase YrpB (nitropropane dioxygenase family)
MRLRTPLCDLLGIEVPVVQAPIGSGTSPALVGAVSEAGALGMLSVTWTEPGRVPRLVQQVRELTPKPFGVNVGLDFAVEAALDAALEAGVRIVSTFWGDPARLRPAIEAAGATHLHTVRSPDEARAAVDAGADVVVAQGWEAGGHVWGEVATLPLVPAVVDAVSPVPVIAAGGIGDGRGLAAALVLGAQGAWLGTRFVAAAETHVHPRYQDLVVGASVTDTAYTSCFDGGWPDAPHRVLRTDTVRAWESAGSPSSPSRPGEGEPVSRNPQGHQHQRYESSMPTPDLEGDIDAMALYAGQSAGLVHDVRPAAEIVQQLVREAEEALARLS